MVVVETELNHINKLYKVVDLESEKMKIEIIQLRDELTTKNEQCKSFETQLRDGKSQVCVGCIAGDRSQRAFYSHEHCRYRKTGQLKIKMYHLYQN